jgi:gluconate 2-dehydrogenase gamma chain
LGLYVALRIIGPLLRLHPRYAVDRRDFLLGAAPVGLATLVAPGCAQQSDAKGRAYTPTYFRPPEWEFVLTAVARLIPSDDPGPGAIEAGVPEFIDRQMELPYGHGSFFYMTGPFHPESPATLGYQQRFTPREIYRLGIEDANTAAKAKHGSEFVRLDSARQDEFLQSMEKGVLEFRTVPAPVLFAQLLENTKEGYLSDPIHGGNRDMVGWRWIGFPGARADFTDWIDQAGKVYPYGPVSIGGSKT